MVMRCLTTQDLKTVYPDLVEQIAAEARSAVVAETRATVDVEGARIEGAEVERARILGIIGHAEAKGREALARKLAAVPTMTVEDAIATLATTPRQKQ